MSKDHSPHNDDAAAANRLQTCLTFLTNYRYIYEAAIEVDVLSLLEEFTLDLLTEIMARNHPYQDDVWDVEAVHRRLLREGEAMKTHTGSDVYLAPGAAGLEKRFSLAHAYPARYKFTEELRMRLKQDGITAGGWDALQAYRQLRQNGTGAAEESYTLDRSTNVESLPAELEKVLENMVDSLLPEMPPLE